LSNQVSEKNVIFHKKIRKGMKRGTTRRNYIPEARIQHDSVVSHYRVHSPWSN